MNKPTPVRLLLLLLLAQTNSAVSGNSSGVRQLQEPSTGGVRWPRDRRRRSESGASMCAAGMILITGLARNAVSTGSET